MKKIIILLFFLSLSSFAQTCFLSRSFVKSIEVLKQVYPNVGKVFVQKDVSPELSYYKSTEIKRLIDEHRIFSFDNLFNFINEGSDLKVKLFLCPGFEEILSKKYNVAFFNDDGEDERNTNFSRIFKPDSRHKTLDVFPFYPLFLDENTIIWIFNCFCLNALVAPDGQVLYLPGGITEVNPDMVIFVFKRIEKGEDYRIILSQFQIVYDDGKGKKIFCDNKKEVREFLNKLKRGERNGK